MIRRFKNTGAFAGLSLFFVFMSGCAHRQDAPATAQQTKTPNIYVPPPAPEELPPMEAKPPANVTDAKPVVAEEVKPKKKSKKPSAPPAPATVPPAVVLAGQPETPAAQDAAKLGALGSGGDASSDQHRDVADKIVTVERRLNDLPATTQEKEQRQIAKVRLFSKEASDALKSGDVDGARILATKAELLLDDLTR